MLRLASSVILSPFLLTFLLVRMSEDDQESIGCELLFAIQAKDTRELGNRPSPQSMILPLGSIPRS